jgi:hypothetical protein
MNYKYRISISRTVNWLSIPKNLWVFIFFCTILMGGFVQFVFLPHIMPTWHRGHGLLKGTDGYQFHQIALELSQTINRDGWGAWEIAPSGQIVSGIAAVFYTLIYPEPWSVLPYNAVMNASAALALFFFIYCLLKDHKWSLLSIIPFLLYPSSLKWNTQFHNENTVIPGMFLVLLGWTGILLFDKTTHKEYFRALVGSCVCVFCGSLLLQLTRDYVFLAITLFCTLAGIGLMVYWLIFSYRTKISFRANLFRVIAIAMLAGVMFLVTLVGTRSAKIDITVDRGFRFVKNWQTTEWLPSYIDGQFRNLAKYRNRITKAWDDGGSSIDLNVQFNSAIDMLLYVPRAAQIGFLSPFPNIWFGDSQKAGGTAMRLISGLETLVSYFCLAGLIPFLRRYHKESAVWFILFVCVSTLILYAMIVPNQGALYRFRYPYFMPLVCLGFAGWLQTLLKFNDERTS